MEKSCRVCTVRYFDFYFQLVVPEGEVSVAEIEKTVECAGNQNQLIQNLVQYIDSDRIRPGLESFRAQFQSVPAEQLANVLGALLDIGDRVKQSGSVIEGRLPEFIYVNRAILDTLDLLPAHERVGALEALLRVTDGVGTAVDLLMTVRSVNERKNNKYTEFDDHALSDLQRVIVDRIKQLSSTRALLDKELLPKILYSWKTWGVAAEATAYVAAIVSNKEDLIRFLDKFVYQTTSSEGREKVAKIQNKLSVRNLVWQTLKLL